MVPAGGVAGRSRFFRLVVTPRLATSARTYGVHDPRFCQALFRPAASRAYIHSCLVPVKPDWNVSAVFSVSCVPVPLTDEPLPLSVHWLFCTVPLPPGVSEPTKPVPASSRRDRLLPTTP